MRSAKGTLKPGGTIVEGTAGNTGIGLAVVANAMGFRTVIVIPETQSQEKKDALRLLGAELVEVPAVPYKNPNNYVKYSGRLARGEGRSPDGAIWANQFDNVANRRGHIETTAAGDLGQTDGKVDGFVSAVGSGGTLGGVSDGLKERNPECRQIALADPHGRRPLQLLQDRRAESRGLLHHRRHRPGPHHRAISKARSSTMPSRSRISEAIPIVFDLLEHEGLCLGGSTGINVAGAIRLAKQLGPGHTIVTMLCDYGTRYQSKLFNPDFLRDKGLAGAGLARSAGAATAGVFEEVPELT